ncbi:MAG: GMC family oxidoreductase [SAR324 cluster bacterium]|nr:GMC family oxidoreductase [SAR324 cluster bacterium]
MHEKQNEIRDFVAEGFQQGWKHLDASSLSSDKTLETDVVIIGSGAGGGSAAEILAEAGLHVIIVEEGPLQTSKDFHMKEDEAYPKLYQESGGRQTKDRGIKIFQGRMVGGGTGINWTTSFRTPATTLKYWAEEMGLKGFSENEMRPWFEWAEKRYKIQKWTVPPNANNSALEKGCGKLGISWGKISRNVTGCLNLGYCGTGCPVNAKQSTLVTTIPGALKAGAMLISKARAEAFVLKKGVITELKCRAMTSRGNAPSGQLITIKARHYVLAAGAIGSPAILLRSGEKSLNPHGLVGTRTFLHPVNVSGAIMPFPVKGEYGAPQTSYSDHYVETRLDNKKPGFKLECPPLQPMLMATALDGHGKIHAEIMKQRPNLQVLIALQRDGFHPESTGGQVYLKSDGTPGLDYQVSRYIWEGIRDAFLAMAEIQFAAGAKMVAPVHRDAGIYGSIKEVKQVIAELPMEILKARLFSAHVMGGCPMGEDSAKSVVNSNGLHHEVGNLSVFDGSVFPTSIAANPMESIFATTAKFATDLAKGMVN